MGLMLGFATNSISPVDYFFQRLLPAVFFQAIFAYLNVGFFIPNILKRKNYLLYFLVALLGIIALLAIRFELIDLLFGTDQDFFRRGPRMPDHPPSLIRRFVGPFFSMLTIWGFSTGYSFFLDWMKSQNESAELRQQQLSAELKFLKNQINPHFLFNTLNNLYTLSYMKDDRAAPMVVKLSEMMRYMLKQTPGDHLPIEEEIAFLQNFIQLQKLKTDAEREVIFEVKGIKSEDKIAPLLLLNFFENSFKHGDWEKNPKGWIRAKLEAKEEGGFHFRLENSVKPTEKREWNKGIGLKNAERRLALLYPEKHKLNIQHLGDSFLVELSIDGERREERREARR
jgi:hypothetical protein